MTGKGLPLRHRLWLIWRVKIRPSPLQREFNRGDPDGKVAAYAALIIAEIEAEDKLAAEKKDRKED